MRQWLWEQEQKRRDAETVRQLQQYSQQEIGARFSLRGGDTLTIDNGQWRAWLLADGRVRVSSYAEGYDANASNFTAYYSWDEFWHFFAKRVDLERWT